MELSLWINCYVFCRVIQPECRKFRKNGVWNSEFEKWSSRSVLEHPTGLLSPSLGIGQNRWLCTFSQQSTLWSRWRAKLQSGFVLPALESLKHKLLLYNNIFSQMVVWRVDVTYAVTSVAFTLPCNIKPCVNITWHHWYAWLIFWLTSTHIVLLALKITFRNFFISMWKNFRQAWV